MTDEQVVDGRVAFYESGVAQHRGPEATRLADLFGSLEGGSLVLRVVYALDRAGRYQVVEWPVAGDQYDPLSDAAPAAFVEECEIYEQFGARPVGAKPLNRLLAPPHAEASFPRLGARPRQAPGEVHAPHLVAGEAFEFPSGPVRNVGQESLYMGLVTSGEEVIDLYLMAWHKHRGLERTLQGAPVEQALFLVERMEGLSAVANSWAFCRAVEAIAEVVPSAGVERTRAIALELERLYNHAAAVAALCQACGLSVAQAQAEIAQEGLLRLNAAAFGHRYLFGVACPGGIGVFPRVDAIGDLLGPAQDELRRVIDAALATNSLLDRLEATGLVSPEAARRLGLVGPVARASGQDIDTRRDHPFGPYAENPPVVALRSAGDVLARTQVMVDEIGDSVRLVYEMLEEGIAGEPSEPMGPPAGAGLGWTESSRGESLAWVRLDDHGRIERCRLRPASARNWRAFDDAARSQNVFTDIPIIEASFWLTVAGLAR